IISTMQYNGFPNSILHLTLRRIMIAMTTSIILVSAGLKARGADITRLDGPWRTATGIKPGSTDAGYDDHLWRVVSLPHDWSITFNPDSAANTGKNGGYLPGVRSTYRHVLSVDSIYDGKYFLYLEGVYKDPEVWINGEEVDSHHYGYTSFRVDITEYLEKGDNTIAIVCENSDQENSLWYTGSGIYRPVWLEHYNPVHIAPRSFYISTPGIRPGMAIGRMTATIDDSREKRETPEFFTAMLTVTDPAGVSLQPEVAEFTLAADQRSYNLLMDFPVPDPELWSPDSPALYNATLTITGPDGVTDEQTVTFGLRTFEFDAEEGAFLNDQPVILNGANVYHDNGILGAASYEAAEWHKVLMLKRAGFNAVLTAHNPPSTTFLDACDHLGMLVIDEAFDGWESPKTPHGYSEVFDSEWPVDLESMILRDRNHPSVIAWSIGNGVLEAATPEAVTLAGEMAELIRSLDHSRPITLAIAPVDENWETLDPLVAKLDMVGYIDTLDIAQADHERDQERVIWHTSETPTALDFENYIKVRDLPYVIGDFVSTGIDNVGNRTGVIDIIGTRKSSAHYRDLLYNNLDTIYMAVRQPGTEETTGSLSESWTWPGMECKTAGIEIITRSPRVRLYLNDTIVDTRAMSEANQYKTVIPLDYRPGTLRAVAIDADEKEGKSVELSTAGKVERINVDFERIPNTGTDYDLVFVNVSLVDKNGNVNPVADDLLTFKVSQDARILATGTADPTDPIGYTTTVRNALGGRAAAVILAPRMISPTLTITNVDLPASTTILTRK
ncbi:MAG: beta-galactosidase, partial [Muribaculaceae bacterium]|nr:beta-galactosidase [Muribaculaceae bacterium]